MKKNFLSNLSFLLSQIGFVFFVYLVVKIYFKSGHSDHPNAGEES